MPNNTFLEDVKAMDDFHIIDLNRAFENGYQTDLTRAAASEYIERMEQYEQLHEKTLIEG